MSAPPDYYNSDQMFNCNLTFWRVFNMQFEKSVFLRRVVHSQSTLQPQQYPNFDAKFTFVQF
jgi:hypothetical protein